MESSKLIFVPFEMDSDNLCHEERKISGLANVKLSYDKVKGWWSTETAREISRCVKAPMIFHDTNQKLNSFTLITIHQSLIWKKLNMNYRVVLDETDETWITVRTNRNISLLETFPNENLQARAHRKLLECLFYHKNVYIFID